MSAFMKSVEVLWCEMFSDLLKEINTWGTKCFPFLLLEFGIGLCLSFSIHPYMLWICWNPFRGCEVAGACPKYSWGKARYTLDRWSVCRRASQKLTFTFVVGLKMLPCTTVTLHYLAGNVDEHLKFWFCSFWNSIKSCIQTLCITPNAEKQLCLQMTAECFCTWKFKTLKLLILVFQLQSQFSNFNLEFFQYKESRMTKLLHIFKISQFYTFLFNHF